MNCVPEYIDELGYTALMYAFEYYGSNPNCDSKVFLKLLDMNCVPEYIDEVGYTALINAFIYYGSNHNCDSNVLLKLLDMDCKPEQVNNCDYTALIYAFGYYGENPNCDSRVLYKIIIKTMPSISRHALINLLNRNNINCKLKEEVIQHHNYYSRHNLLKNRISKRRQSGKHDSISLF
jgi:DNA-directed RNA polymerase subunit RPC12/RpoP